MVKWLREHDNVARTVALNAKRFAATHLGDEGRMCYIKVLFEEMAQLYRGTVRAPADFQRAVPLEQELAFFKQPQQMEV
jgi:hypothetical protein